MPKPLQPGAALITGASSGIGRALALALARSGTVLHLSGRDEARLDAVCAEARALGADARPRVLDVADRDAMAAWIGGAGPLDLVVANAGISKGTGSGRAESAERIAEIMATNYSGMVNTAMPALALMRGQAPGADGLRGRIATVASIAAFFPSPAAPAYCASKAAADSWTVATAPVAARWGIAMTSVCPGFVRTAMTERNRFYMPRHHRCRPRGANHPARHRGGAAPGGIPALDGSGNARHGSAAAAPGGRDLRPVRPGFGGLERLRADRRQFRLRSARVAA